MNKLIVCVLLLSAAAACFAPIKDQRPLTPQAERSQAQLAEEQRLQQVTPVVGVAPETTRETEAKADMSNLDGKSVVADASKAVDERQARENLVEASRDLQKSKKGNLSTLFWAAGFLTLGVGGAFGFRHWAGKVAPEMPTTPSKKPKW